MADPRWAVGVNLAKREVSEEMADVKRKAVVTKKAVAKKAPVKKTVTKKK